MYCVATDWEALEHAMYNCHIFHILHKCRELNACSPARLPHQTPVQKQNGRHVQDMRAVDCWSGLLQDRSLSLNSACESLDPSEIQGRQRRKLLSQQPPHLQPEAAPSWLWQEDQSREGNPSWPSRLCGEECVALVSLGPDVLLVTLCVRWPSYR
mmetsp:Transcript_749/g.1356  ORF Transcript_749/g.1356 Transcript_749/m.1356 type:complete len:155 (-) Transcript_749:986-1450(-)